MQTTRNIQNETSKVFEPRNNGDYTKIEVEHINRLLREAERDSDPMFEAYGQTYMENTPLCELDKCTEACGVRVF